MGKLKEFSQTTSAHGIPRIGASVSKWGRTVWTIIVVVCLVIFLIEARLIIMKYLAKEKIVSIELQFGEVNFPAVTICNLNPYKLSRLDDQQVLNDAETEKASGSKRQLSKREQAQPVELRCKCTDDWSRECVEFLYRSPDDADLCICQYDGKAYWPCYRASNWNTTLCSRCNKFGRCLTRDTLDGIPCICHGASICLATVDLATTVAPTPPFQLNQTETEDLLDSALNFTDRIEIFEPFMAPEVEEEEAGELAPATKSKENLIFSMAAIPLAERIAMSYGKHEFIQECSFNGRKCNIEKDFVLHPDPMFGNCFTFNFNESKQIRSKKAGPMYGLRVLTMLNTSDYLPFTEASGAKIEVHDQHDYPFPDTFGYSAPAGFLSSFGIRMKKLNRIQRPGYIDCVVDGKTKNYIYKNHSYTLEGCYRSCFQQDLIRHCGCGDPRFPVPDNHTTCDVSDTASRGCLDARTSALGGLHHGSLVCDCAQPCQKTSFAVAFSTARWPSENLQRTACDEFEDLKQCQKYFRKHAVMIEVFYEQLNFEVLRESAAYEFANFLADIGGQIGLWLGFSFITCCECVLLLWNLLCGCMDRRDRLRKPSPADVIEEPQETIQLTHEPISSGIWAV